MGALFNALFHADGQVADTVLFEIDEARVLGPMKEIMLAHTTARKYQGALHTIWQSEAQIDGVWGQEGAKELRDCCAWRSYNAVQDVVHVRDLHATVLHLLGIDHDRFSVKYQGLDMRLTGVEPARVVKDVLRG